MRLSAGCLMARPDVADAEEERMDIRSVSSSDEDWGPPDSWGERTAGLNAGSPISYVASNFKARRWALQCMSAYGGIGFMLSRWRRRMGRDGAYAISWRRCCRTNGHLSRCSMMIV